MKSMATACLSLLLCAFAAQAQNGLSAPYPVVQHQWAKPVVGETWGATAGIERGPRGEIWALDRCGGTDCLESDRNPVVLLDPDTGKGIRGFGAGLFVVPHGLHVDRQGNIWVTDAGANKDGTKGVQVFKFSPDGKVLLRLGTAGRRGSDAAHFQSPGDVITAPNGDIFVTDGHGTGAGGLIPAGLPMRMMKFDAKGNFIKQWGTTGKKAGDFDTPHALAFDARGRLFVADRSNNRIQIFDQDGNYLTEWKQFGRPSGIYIAGDRIHVIDADSSPTNHPGEWKKGVWIGSVSRGLPDAFVPDDQPGEGIIITPKGDMLGAVNAAPRGITRYSKK